MERVDVAIVGGGPAGASAAEQAAAHGAETVLFEQGVPREDREEIGPDSTDAAGMLDYWIDIMGFDYREIPDDVILQELEATEFISPNSAVELRTTGMNASYPKFGYTFHRARMDDWLYERATEAGADLRVGVGVKDLETDLRATSPQGPTHTLTLSNGDQLEAQYVVLADGPQRRITLEALDQFTTPGRSVSDYLSPPEANHIAYQEYREFPEELFAEFEDTLKFWWGYMPGETAYPWVFPNDGTVARVGLTMPIGMDLEDVDNPGSYKLLRPDDEKIPSGAEYIRRLLEQEYGSAFHEGGYHVAVRTGKIAGRLAGTNSLENYNDVWKNAVGDEILRNVAFADIVEDYGPDDWDWAFSTINDMQGDSHDNVLISKRYTAGFDAAKILAAYKRRKFGYRDGRYVQLSEADYFY